MVSPAQEFSSSSPQAANTTSPAVLNQDNERAPMPKDLFGKLYAMRDGQLELILDIGTEAGVKEFIAQYRASQSLPQYSQDKNIIRLGDGHYNCIRTDASVYVQSWGDAVEFAIDRKIDLSGLTLSPEQKQYSYRLVLQNRTFRGVTLDHANFDGMDLSGTDFTKSPMNFVSLKNTTGVKTNFESVTGQKMDFSGAKYTEPNFESMKALRANHFGSVYDQARFLYTDWNSSHLVGTHFFVKKPPSGNFTLDLSNSLAAACLFFGMGIEKVDPLIRCNQAAFPGSCFHNLILTAGDGYMQKADFSALALKDPRLTEEEAVYAKSFGQWLNSYESMDGLKVSSEIQLPTLDPSRIYSMFSETQVGAYNRNAQTIFFSKREVLSRVSFHECGMVDLNTLLPKEMRIAPPPVQEEHVIQEVVPETKAEFLQVPQVTLDRAKLDEQIEELKTATIAGATAVGADLQAAFSKASTFVAQWAIAGSGHQSAFSRHLKDLAARIEAYSLDEPEPVAIVVPEPVVEPPRKGLMARMAGAFFGAETNTASIPAAPVIGENEQKFIVIRQDITGLPDLVTTSIEKSSGKLDNIEELTKYLNTLQEAMTAYNEGIDKVLPELEKDKGATFVKTVGIRRQSLGRSEGMLKTLNTSVEALLDIEVNKMAGIQWVQGSVLPTLNTQFTTVSGLHDLSVSLKKGDGAYQKDQILTGLYNVCAEKAGESKPEDQIKLAFEASKAAIVAALHEVLPVLEDVEIKKAAALAAILQPN